MYAIIVSSNEIFRKGIRYTLSHEFSKMVTEECCHYEGFVQKVQQYKPNLVIIDLESKKHRRTHLLRHRARLGSRPTDSA